MTRKNIAVQAPTVVHTIRHFFYSNPDKVSSVSMAHLTVEVTPGFVTEDGLTEGVTVEPTVRYFYTNRKMESIEIDRKTFDGYWVKNHTELLANPTTPAQIEVKKQRAAWFDANGVLTRERTAQKAAVDSPEVPAFL